MAAVWLGSLLVLSGVTLLFIRKRFGPRYVARQVAHPLALIERSLTDAIGELAAESSDMAIDGPRALPFDNHVFQEGGTLLPSPREDVDCFVNPFEPACEQLARIPHGYIASLGAEAASAHLRLLAAMRTWNAAAGRAESPRALLPTVMAAHLAARDLSRFVMPEELDQARKAADQRILFGLVAPTDAHAPTAGFLQ